MIKVTPEKWNTCDGIVLEKNAEIAVKETDNNILVIAGPGAGKTELLAQKASYLFQTNICCDPQKILAISFKNDAADNLKKRVIKRCGNEVENRFVSLTYDAFAKGILDHFIYALPNDLRPDYDYMVNDDETIEAAFKKAGYNKPDLLSGSKIRAFYEEAISSVTLPFSQNNLGELVWKLLIKGFDDHKSTLSFKMVSILAEYIIRTNPKIKRGLQFTYSYVFLDEFQDTTGLQYNLVKQCFLNSNSFLTAVGDSKQRIMVWAGASKTIFTDYKNDFNANETHLLMNHRSAPKLVELQKMMYSSLQEKNCNINVSSKWQANEGEISLLIADEEERERQVIASSIIEKVSSGIAPNELCILCKQLPQNYSSHIIEELKSNNIYARIENDYQDLLKETVVEIITSLLKLSIDIKQPEKWEFILDELSKLWNIDVLQEDDSYYKMQEKLTNEISTIRELTNNVISKTQFHSLLKNIVDFVGISHLKALIPSYNQGRYLNDRLNKFQNLMWEQLETTGFDWQLALENFEGLHSIPIMTIHKSKGLEYDTVYFVGLEDKAFWNFSQRSEEDRCAFFVALSRAKREVMFTFCKRRYYNSQIIQSHKNINEFFELLKAPGIAQIIG